MALDHFERNARQKGRTNWNFNILFDDQPQVADYVGEYAPALRHDGLYPPVPDEWLHATVLRVGFWNDFTEREMLEVVKRLEPKLAELCMPEFLLGQWWIWGGNPCVHFTPEGPLVELFKLVVGEVVAVVGSNRAPKPSRFTPHITLAYSKTYSNEKGLFEQLQLVRVDAVPVRTTRLSLIKQRIVNHYYAWEVVKDIRIGQAE